MPKPDRHLSLRALIGAGLLCLPVRAQSPIGILISGQSRTGFTVQGAGARAVGLGGAFIAIADDATAASFNPAGLAQLLKPEMSFVARDTQRSVSYEEFQTTSRGRELAVSDSLIGSRHFDPLFLSSTVPIRLGGRNLALQLSVQRAFTLGEGDARNLTETPTSDAAGGSPTHLKQAINQSGQIDLYSLAMAYECSQRILLGITYNQWRGRWDLDSTSSKGPTGTESYVRFRQTNQLDGQNFNFGLIWRWPTWSLGLVHRTPFRATYSFATRIDTNLTVTVPLTASAADMGLHWPESNGLGLAFRLPDHWLLTGDVEQTLWSQAKYMTEDKSLNGTNFFNLSKSAKVPNATTLRFGVEKLWVTPKGLLVPLRFGVSREPQPVVDRLTGDQRILYGAALGTGLKRGRYALDLAYRYGWAKRRAAQFLDVDQIISGTNTTSVGTERTVDRRLDLSFIVQFERQPVDRMLRHLFVGD
jgi:hypothetical protein